MATNKNASASKNTAKTAPSKAPIKQFQCVICLNQFNFVKKTAFGTTSCNHWSCRDCIRRYFQDQVKVNNFQSNNVIECPSYGCKLPFKDETLYDIFFEIFTNEEERAWWSTALRKTFIKNEVRCPLGTCGAVFDANIQDLQNCNFTECYECRKGFCMTCDMQWNDQHEENGNYFLARETEKTGEDLWKEHNKTLDLAEEQKWTRCPKCAHIVSIADGCNHIICRCGISFCYNCGRQNCGDQCYDMDQQQLKDIRTKMFNF